MASIDSTFQDASLYTYDDTLVNIVGGEARLKLIDDSKTFTQNYNSSTGFTLDSSKTEFSGGVLRQKDNAPANSTCWAKLSSNVNLNYGGGTLTGTVSGSATINSSYLKFSNVLGQQVSYSAGSNFTSQQTGSVKFIYNPQYSGSPTTNQFMFCSSQASGDSTNQIILVHETTGNLRVYFTSSTDTLSNHIFGSWSPTSGTDYEIEFCFDITTGAQYLFIDGTKTGTDGTLTLTRSSSIGLIRIGADSGGSDTPNFWIKDLIFYDNVQHTASYTSGYTLPNNRYLGDIITYPSFTYSGLGNIQDYTDFNTVSTGNVVYSVNSKYWDGSAWIHSNGATAQMNDSATIDAKIEQLPASDTVSIQARTSDSSTQMSFDNLEIVYNGQIYPTSNPTIEPKAPFNMEQLQGFVETSIKPSADEIKYALKTNGGYLYWSGSAWVTSDGSYLQANTASEVVTNMDSFTSENIEFNFKMFLHSNDGSSTPACQNIKITYDFGGESEDEIHITSVYFYSRYPDGTVNPDAYKATPTKDYVRYKNNTLIALKDIEVIPHANGYSEFQLVENINMEPLDGSTGVMYKITQGETTIARIEVPVQTGVLLWDAIK